MVRWLRWLRWYRYEAVIHGLESGDTTPLSFVRFKTEKEADLWTQEMNQLHNRNDPNPLTLWDYREIG